MTAVAGPRLGVNLPNFGPGTDRGMLAAWARRVEDLGFGLLMTSDHLVVTEMVAEQYPAPFFEPLTTLAWLAGRTERLMLGTTVLVLPYRHPLQVARIAANLAELSEGRFILGVGVGWAADEFAALGVEFARRGAITDQYLAEIREAWARPDLAPGVPIWVGGNSAAAVRRAVRVGEAWHPIGLPLARLRRAPATLEAAARAEGRPVPQLAPRLNLRITPEPVTDVDRPAGTGSLEQVRADLEEVARLGAVSIVFDTFTGRFEEIAHPDKAWDDLRSVAELREELGWGSG